MTQTANPKWNNTLFAKKFKTDPTKTWCGSLSISGIPDRFVPIDFGEDMKWMPEGFTQYKPLKLRKSRPTKEKIKELEKKVNQSLEVSPESNIISNKGSIKSLRNLFKKHSWSKTTTSIIEDPRSIDALCLSPEELAPSPPISPEWTSHPLHIPINLEITAPPVISSLTPNISFQSTFSQTIYKLRSRRRPLRHIVLMQHMLLRLQSTQDSLLASPTPTRSLSWPRSPPSHAPLIVLPLRTSPRPTIIEDDDIPIAFLKPRSGSMRL